MKGWKHGKVSRIGGAKWEYGKKKHKNANFLLGSQQNILRFTYSERARRDDFGKVRHLYGMFFCLGASSGTMCETKNIMVNSAILVSLPYKGRVPKKEEKYDNFHSAAQLWLPKNIKWNQPLKYWHTIWSAWEASYPNRRVWVLRTPHRPPVGPGWPFFKSPQCVH